MNKKGTYVAVGLAIILALAIGLLINVRIRSNTQNSNGAPVTAGQISDRERRLFRESYIVEYDGNSIDDLDDDKRARLLRDQEWAENAQFISVSAGAGRLADAWGGLVEDPFDLLSPAERGDLLKTLAAHAIARAQDSPTAYIQLIESSPDLVWNDPDPAMPDRIELRRRDFQVGIFFRYYLEKDLPQDAEAKPLLDEVWDGLARFDHLIDEIGVNDKGARILVTRVRVPAELGQFGLTGKYAPDNAEYWWSYGSRYGMQFLRPQRDAAAVLEGKPSLTVAFANIIIRLRDGRMANWQSVWYLDPETNRWVLNLLQSSAGKNVMLIW